MLNQSTLLIAGILAVVAGWTDWRWRRIPNWLTVPAFVLGIALNSLLFGWTGAKSALAGAGLGLLLPLPFVLIRTLGAGDWKLVAAIGALLGPRELLNALFVAILIAGLIAMLSVIYYKRAMQTLRNIGRLLLAFATGHPGIPEISLDNPQSLRDPFGVALGIAVLLLVARRLTGHAS